MTARKDYTMTDEDRAEHQEIARIMSEALYSDAYWLRRWAGELLASRPKAGETWDNSLGYSIYGADALLAKFKELGK